MVLKKPTIKRIRDQNVFDQSVEKSAWNIVCETAQVLIHDRDLCKFWP